MTEYPSHETGAGRFARAWAAAIIGTCYLPMEQVELEAFLTLLTEQLRDDLRRQPFDQRSGQEIGAALVTTAHLTSPEGIGRTIQVMDNRLLADLGLTDEHPRTHLAELLSAVTTGFARALRDRTLDEQESIRRAALLTRHQTELALRESEARFRYQATHDPLTDLANRTLFTERLAALFPADPPPAVSRRLGVCFVDLDGFKVVNDTLGHHIGDLLLAALADRLRRRLPSHLIARLGGDEFVILLEDTVCIDDVIKVADTALAAISEPTRVDGHELIISASIGVVERPVHGTDPSDVMRAADITLQWAKAAGKGRWALFDAARHQQDLARYGLSAAMPAALERTEFFVEYQPLVSLRDGRILGAEALVRWLHPELGMLRPDQFISLAEETGLIVRLGGWVLGEACRQASGWGRWCADPPYVSVNLAVRQVRDPGLINTVTSVLAESGLPARRLQLEITESAVIGTDDEPLRVLHALSELGVRLAIDDFGTGYSNLAYLRKLPVCELKVAGSFVSGLREPSQQRRDGNGPDSSTDEQILATLVSLAHTLGLSVTAEGVETSYQAQQLRKIGCDAAQGWHFDPPGTPEQLTGWLTDH